MRRAERGSSMVEFAIAAALLLLVLFGTIDYGRLLYTKHAVANAARQGSRWAIVHGKDSGAPADSAAVQSYVRGLNIPLLDANAISVTAAWPGNTGCSVASGTKNGHGCLVSVQVSYAFGFAALSRNSTITLNSTSQMIISR